MFCLTQKDDTFDFDKINNNSLTNVKIKYYLDNFNMQTKGEFFSIIKQITKRNFHIIDFDNLTNINNFTYKNLIVRLSLKNKLFKDFELKSKLNQILKLYPNKFKKLEEDYNFGKIQSFKGFKIVELQSFIRQSSHIFVFKSSDKRYFILFPEFLIRTEEESRVEYEFSN
jgi:hypothetical protein